MGEDTALAVQQPDYMPTFVISPEDAAKNIAELQRFVQSQMKQGLDYGTIPGTDKPTLLKPGAERLCEMYGYAISASVTHRIEDWEHGRFHYEVRCDLVHKRTGTLVASGVGSCNSMESRYRFRWAWPEQVPAGVNEETLVTRKTRSGKVQYRLVNDDPYSLVNTILKMAKKRALVDAALSATRSSGIFTQDVEDMDLGGDGDGGDTPAARQQQPPTPAATPQHHRATPATTVELKAVRERVMSLLTEKFGDDATAKANALSGLLGRPVEWKKLTMEELVRVEEMLVFGPAPEPEEVDGEVVPEQQGDGTMFGAPPMED
jgi:hypothetical protein